MILLSYLYKSKQSSVEKIAEYFIQKYNLNLHNEEERIYLNNMLFFAYLIHLAKWNEELFPFPGAAVGVPFRLLRLQLHRFCQFLSLLGTYFSKFSGD